MALRVNSLPRRERRLSDTEFESKKTLRERYDILYERGEKISHDGWYGSPAKRPVSTLYLKNYDQIKWKRGE